MKNLFLEISQNSQENTCARVSFLIKLQEISKNTFFYRTPLVAASGYDINGSIHCAKLNPEIIETLAGDQNEFHVGKLVDSFTLHIAWTW